MIIQRIIQYFSCIQWSETHFRSRSLIIVGAWSFEPIHIIYFGGTHRNKQFLDNLVYFAEFTFEFLADTLDFFIIGFDCLIKKFQIISNRIQITNHFGAEIYDFLKNHIIAIVSFANTIFLLTPVIYIFHLSCQLGEKIIGECSRRNNRICCISIELGIILPIFECGEQKYQCAIRLRHFRENRIQCRANTPSCDNSTETFRSDSFEIMRLIDD